MIGAELLCIVLWFNPAVYLFRRLIHETLEFSADRAVLAEGIHAKKYQLNLLKVSLSGSQSVFVNQFSGPTLRQRIGMMNGQRSGLLASWRYVLWVLLMSGMAFACRHKQSDHPQIAKFSVPAFPSINATRALAAELDKPGMPWFRASAFLKEQNQVDTVRFQNRIIIRSNSATTRYPEILCLRNNHLELKLPDGQQAKLFINGKEEPVQSLSALTFNEVNDLLVYQKWEDLAEASAYPESHRVFVSTTHKTPAKNPVRTRWEQYLRANAVSDHPLGQISTFSMNKLLEATFFQNKLAFVERTKKDYLKLYDEYATDIDLYINGLPADGKSIEGIHVREVDKLYTQERRFEEWADAPNRKHRFLMNIQTSPKRAKRDSSYYVFSPFYSGDF